jgi:hypothetical protein
MHVAPEGNRRATDSGAADADADMIWIAEQCLAHGVRIDAYVRSAERCGDWELARFFRRVLTTAKLHADRAAFNGTVGP